MGFIKNLNVKSKISVIVAPLVITLLLFSLYILNSKYTEKNNIQKVMNAAELGLLLNHALHELQAERGYAVTYLDAKNESAKDPLIKQYAKTDDKIRTLKKRIDNSEIESFSQRFQDAIRSLEERIADLSKFRQAVLSDKFSGQESISEYSDINRTFIAFFEALVSDSKNDIISKKLSAALNFSKSKERAGKERAVLSSVFFKKEMNADEYRKFAFNIAEQNSYLDAFLVTATEDEIDFYVQKLEDESMFYVEDYRERAINRDFVDIDPADWNQVIAKKIDLLKEVEDYINEKIDTESKKLVSNANSGFNFFLIITLILLITLSVLIHKVLKIILDAIDQLNEAASEISSGNTEARLELDIRDELGSLAKSFNIMAESIESKINDINVEKERVEKIADENSRIKEALDNASTNVIVTNTENKINYVNKSARKMFEDFESEIKTVIKDFRSNQLIGFNSEELYSSSENYIQKIKSLNTTFLTEIIFGNKILQLTANPVFNDKNEKLGLVIELLDQTMKLSDLIGKEIVEKEIRREAISNLRIRNALDNASSNVIVADTSGQIIYMNNAFKKLFGKNEKSIQQDLPHFHVDQLLGNNYDSYHRDPSHQRKLLQNLTQTYSNELLIGGRTYTITANPVFDGKGERLGSVVEWEDITEELSAQDEVNEVVEAAKDGDINVRINENNKSGFIKIISEGINELLDAVVAPIRESVPVLEALSEGDLRKEVTGVFKGDHAKIRDGLNKTIRKLNDLMEQINTNVNQVSMGASQVAQTSNSLSKGAQDQANAIEEISSTIVELTSQTNQNAENATQANQLSGKVKADADNGVSKMKEMLGAMKEISESSENIGKIIKVIDEIAFQTNLLALNAAVEAARAGQHGKGFAVVAEEVRNLAQRSANAAKETTELIETSMKRVELGSEIATDTDKALTAIVQGVSKVSDFVGEISAASGEQKNGIEQVNKSIMSIDGVTQSNSAGAEEGAAASEELAAQANEVQSLIAKFKLKNISSDIKDMKDFKEDQESRTSRLERYQKEKQSSNEKKPKDLVSLDDMDFGDF